MSHLLHWNYFMGNLFTIHDNKEECLTYLTKLVPRSISQTCFEMQQSDIFSLDR